MMSRIDSRHWTISTVRHFQNGHHNTAKIQHCPISSKFDMWVGNDVLNWFPTLKKFYWLSFSKWPPQYHTNSTLSDFNTISCVGRLWCPRIDSWHWKISTGLYFQNGHHNIAKIQHCPISSQFDMWVDNDVKNWFSTLNNFYCLPFSKWPPQYRKNSTLSDIIKIWYVGR
jgi:hypothetical protein